MAEEVMVRMPRRVDSNHGEIVAALRKGGATVQSLAAIGQGCPDLLVGFRGVNYLFEVKDGAKSPSRRCLTEDETEWAEKWNGQWNILMSIDDVAAWLGGN
jgi:hypothetical protein